jgi:hypothetical protein
MKKFLIPVALLALFCFGLTACDMSSVDTTPTTGTVQDSTKYCDPNASLACKDIQKRYKLFANADQFGYFYGFVQGVPEPVIVYVTQGAVFPLDDMVTPPDKNVPCNSSGSGACAINMQNQQPDGTWSTNGDGFFGFQANGQYFEWAGPGLGHAFSFQPLSFRATHVVGCPTSGGPAICK